MKSKIIWWVTKLVIKSNLELPEKVSNVATPFLGVLSNSYELGFCLSNSMVCPPPPPPHLWEKILIGALVLAI